MFYSGNILAQDERWRRIHHFVVYCLESVDSCKRVKGQDMTSSGVNNLLQTMIDREQVQKDRELTTSELVDVMLQYYRESPPRSFEQEVYDLQRGFTATKSSHVHF